MNRHFSFFVMILSIRPLLAGCGKSPPGEVNGKAVLEYVKKREFSTAASPKTNVVVESFQKTNGQMKTVDGVDTYILSYDAILQFPDGYRIDCIGFDRRHVTINTDLFCAMIQGIPKGGRLKASGSLTFEWTEKGWKGEDGNIY